MELQVTCSKRSVPILRFNPETGKFKILQVADMHITDGNEADLKTQKFVSKLIAEEKPDLVVFTGDNIFGGSCKDPAESQVAAFAPAVNAKVPWAAILGNHDAEGKLNREQLMNQIASMDYSLAQVNPSDGSSKEAIDGYGNFNLQVKGVSGTSLADLSLLNLFFLDSGDYPKVSQPKSTYDWIKTSQQQWFSRTSQNLQAQYKSQANTANEVAPTLVYFHIPLPEYRMIDKSTMIGVKNEEVCSPDVNSGFFDTMKTSGDVKAVFVGHDHVNDFCGQLDGIQLCFGGGIGYNTYPGSAVSYPWSRRARIVVASLGRNSSDGWGEVSQITTWKRLDDDAFSIVDEQVLWSS